VTHGAGHYCVIPTPTVSSSYELRASTFRSNQPRDHGRQRTEEAQSYMNHGIARHRCLGREIRHVNERRIKGEFFPLPQVAYCSRSSFLVANHLRRWWQTRIRTLSSSQSTCGGNYYSVLSAVSYPYRSSTVKARSQDRTRIDLFVTLP
jgi:hypothetical protein